MRLIIAFRNYANAINNIESILKPKNFFAHGRFLTHCGRVTQICVFTLQLCRTGDADLRFYVTAVQDG